MSAELTATRPAATEVNPPAIALGASWPWALFMGAMMLAIYVVAMGPGETLHEWAHDGRHLLGFPCH